MAAEEITVSVGDDHLASIDEVVARLEAAGMRVDQVLRPIGMITGVGVVAELVAVAGVAAVEARRRFRPWAPDAGIRPPAQ